MIPTMPTWPNYCCVAAFVYEGLLVAGSTPPEPAILARSLGISIPLGAPNPWGLSFTPDPNLAGAVQDNVHRFFENIQKIDPSLMVGFRYVPMTRIALGYWVDVVSQAIERNLVVGIGLDWLRIQHSAEALGTTSARHVIQIVGADENKTTFKLYDRNPGGDVLNTRTDAVEIACQAVSSGLWIIGERSSLQKLRWVD